DAYIHPGDRRDVRGERHLSPRPLAILGHQELDEAARPLDDLRPHRRHVYAVRQAGHAAWDRACGVGDRMGRRDSRNRADTVLADGPALAGRDTVSAAGLGGGLVYRDDPAQRRIGRNRAAGCGRRAIQPWSDILWPALARPLADHVRLPRDL